MRTSPRYLLASACLLLAAAACGRNDAATDTAAAAAANAPSGSGGYTKAESDADLADVTSYELTMDKIDKFIAAQRNVAQKAAAMSPAEREAMKLRDDGDDNNNDDGLDDMARKISAHPVMNAAVREAGLSPREFALVTISMMQSAMAAAVLKMRPNDNQDSLVREMKANMDNVRFYQKNEAEIARKTTELQAEMKRLGMDQ